MRELDLHLAAQADATVDELMAPFVEPETRPMRLRRERAEARSAFDARVAQRVAESRQAQQEYTPKLSPTAARGPSAVPVPYERELLAQARRIFAEQLETETSVAPVPFVIRSPEEHEQMTLTAAIALGLVEEPTPETPDEPQVEDDEEAEPEVDEPTPDTKTPGEEAPAQ